jgi:DNA-binding response OmpR family regulator
MATKMWRGSIRGLPPAFLRRKTTVRVLVVEDSARLRTYVAKGLRHAGYAVDVAGDGEEGLWMAETIDYDVLVLDLMLPKLDGLSILNRLRAQGNSIHVLILTAKDTVEDRVNGLGEGADDYLVKPFAMEELVARVQALARRSYGLKNPQLTVDDLAIDTSRRTVTRNGGEVSLKPREYALLEYLVLRRGEVVSRKDIEHHIYDDRSEPVSNAVDSAICTLRKKIDVADGPSHIQTRRGMGYVIEGPGS